MRGNEGMGIYLRAKGYWVEWFSLATEETKIIDKMGPFETREEAQAAEKGWRRDLEEVKC